MDIAHDFKLKIDDSCEWIILHAFKDKKYEGINKKYKESSETDLERKVENWMERSNIVSIN